MSLRVRYNKNGSREVISNIKLSTTEKSSTLLEKRRELRDTEIKFQKACRQLAHLNKRLSDVKRRCNDASGCLRYNLKLKLSVLEGVRSMYYDYVYMKSEDINMLRHDVRFWVEESSESEYETEDEE